MIGHNSLQHYFTTYSAADRVALCTTMMDVVRANAGQAEAWLYLGLCSETTQQRRECLERALRLAPLEPAIHDALRDLQQQEAASMRRLLRDCKPLRPAPDECGPSYLGSYLQSQGVDECSIKQALRIQRAAPLTSRRPLLGEILVAQGWISPERITDILIEQARLRVAARAFSRPVMLGEFLVLEGLISFEQLHAAMLAQMRTIQAGGYLRLGEVLLAQSHISDTALRRALDQQEEEYKALLY